MYPSCRAVSMRRQEKAAILWYEYIYFIYSQYHDNIYIQVYTCANGLDVGIAYICPLQLVRQFKYIYTHIVMQLQKLQVVQIHLYIYKVLVIGMNMNVNSNR